MSTMNIVTDIIIFAMCVAWLGVPGIVVGVCMGPLLTFIIGRMK